MTVRQLLAETDSRELSEWMAYSGKEGLGEIRADFRAGQLCALIANIHRQEDARPMTPADFMPALQAGREEEDEPEHSGLDAEGAVLRPSAEDQSRLIMLAVFGKAT